MDQTMEQPAQQRAETPTDVNADEPQTQTLQGQAQGQTQQANGGHFPFLVLAGELRNKIYEHDVAANYSTIHLVTGIGAFRKSPLASLNKQVRREYLSIANDTRSPIEAVVRNLDFSHVIKYVTNIPELTAKKSGERAAGKATASPAQAESPSDSSKTVQDTAAESANPATENMPTSGKTKWSDAALPRKVTIKLVFSKPNSSKRASKARAPALLTLLPQPRSAQSKRWNSRLSQWKNFISTEPKLIKLNIEYQAKTRMPFEMVSLKVWGTRDWEDVGADEECRKLDKALEFALGRDTSGFYQVAPMIEASDEEDEGQENGGSKESFAGEGRPQSWW